MQFVVADHRDANATGNFPKEEMTGKALQIDAPPVASLAVEPARVGGDQLDERIQLVPKLIPQPIIDAVLVAQDSRDILLHSGR
ncbi:hypothetical protein LBMAG56_16770 [Verrucomicrobiota bacterium]|nr:hypothetical protein LBMAG56_16770 [Verrucomicrobiota bacterium]